MCVEDNVAIETGADIGHDAVVVRDVPDKSVVVGNSARKIRDNKERKVFDKHKLSEGVVLKLNSANFSCIGEDKFIPRIVGRELA